MLSEWTAKLQDPLVIFGLTGQCVFMFRFLLQWFASERLGRSHVPVGFWYLSLLGGLMLLVYGVLDRDPVILLGQSLGLLIYIRNLMLIHRHARRTRSPDGQSGIARDPVSAQAPSPGA